LWKSAWMNDGINGLLKSGGEKLLFRLRTKRKGVKKSISVPPVGTRFLSGRTCLLEKSRGEVKAYLTPPNYRGFAEEWYMGRDRKAKSRVGLMNKSE